MRKTGKASRAKTTTLEASQTQSSAEALDADTLWPIAMLRIAMELKRPEAPGLDEIIAGVVKKMGIPKAQFERYVADHLGTLQEAAKKSGYTR